MTPLHPHWEDTDTASTASPAPRPVAAPAAARPTVAALPKAQAPIAVPRGSPRPAALLGIFLTVGMGAYMFNSQWSLTGQVSSNIDVTISSTGFDPSNVSVIPGQMINWTNTDSIAHTIEVASPVPGGSPLAKIEIEPGGSATVTIPEQLAYGLYAYSSTDDPPLTGQITVIAPPASAEAGASGDDQAAATADDEAYGIERNPYTVDNEGSSTASLAPAPLVAPRAAQGGDDSQLHGGAPLRNTTATTAPTTTAPARRAPQQPKSGPETWLLALAGLAAFGLSMRKTGLTQ